VLKVRPWVPYAYCAPLVALLAFIFGYPIVKVLDFSTRLVRGATGPFIGLDNYRFIWDDATFHDALKHSLVLLVCVPVLLVLSIVIATLLYEQLAGWRVFRTVLFAPYIPRPMGRYLAEHDVNYLDLAGNCRLVLGRRYATHVEGRTRERPAEERRGLRVPGYLVLFAILAEPKLLEATVRGLADAAGTRATQRW